MTEKNLYDHVNFKRICLFYIPKFENNQFACLKIIGLNIFLSQ